MRKNIKKSITINIKKTNFYDALNILFKSLLWPFLLLFLGTLLVLLTNSTFGLTDTELILYALLVALKFIFLALGCPINFGIEVWAAPLVITFLIFLIQYLHYRKNIIQINLYVPIFSTLFFEVIFGLGYGLINNWNFINFLSSNLISLLAWLLFNFTFYYLTQFNLSLWQQKHLKYLKYLGVNKSNVEEHQENLKHLIKEDEISLIYESRIKYLIKFQEKIVYYLGKNFNQVIKFFLLLFSIYTLIFTLIQIRIYFEQFLSAFANLEDVLQISIYSLLIILFLPNLLMKESNHLFSLFDQFSLCKNPEICDTNYISKTYSFPLLDFLYFEPNWIWTLFSLTFCLIIALIIYYKLLYQIKQFQTLIFMILRTFSVLFIFDIFFSIFWWLSGIEVGNLTFSGYWSELLFINLYIALFIGIIVLVEKLLVKLISQQKFKNRISE